MTGMATICSGIGAPEEAARPLGWQSLWCAEIEPFPSAVLAVRHPEAANLGDMTAPDFVSRALAAGMPDVIVAGTPCQAFSVAGRREGLGDHRGNLTLRFVEIIDELRAVGFDGYVLWENVPGVLSDRTNAFGCLLAGLVGADSAIQSRDGWPGAGVVAGPAGTAAWRIMDAQYFGVAQRRRRVFVVLSIGDRADSPEILFEFEGVRRDLAPRREAGQGTAPTIAARTRGGGGLGTDAECDGALIASTGEISHCLNAGAMGRIDYETETLVAHSLRADGFDASEDGTGRGTPIIPIDMRQASRGATMTNNRTDGGAPGTGIGEPGDPSPSLAGSHTPAVAFQEAQTGCREYSTAGTLRSNGPGHDPVGTRVREGMAVRRLTPRECERLQGFPDDYTLIQFRGKPAADSGRYKSLGNSMAVPVIRWILGRIAAGDRRRQQL